MILDRFKLDGKVAIVTGGSKGIGKAFAEALAEAGADLALVARTQSDLDATAAQIRQATGRRVMTHAADLGDLAQIQPTVEAVVAEYGGIDILVNNAGVINRAPALEYTPEMWDEVMRINIRGAFFMAQACARVMAERGGGKIINTASLLSAIGVPLIPAYTASKGGIGQLTKSLAVEWAQYNINVNAIAPGYFKTDNTRALQQDPQRNAIIINRVPFHRWGELHELQGAVVFLASEASNYITGQLIFVDGGWTAT